jgi:hypothetical protein
VIELYEATLEPKHLEFALNLAEAILARFYDSAQGGFWQTAPGAADLILRIKEDYDGAQPSGNSVVSLCFLKLGRMTGRQDLVEAAEKTLRLYSARLEQLPQAVPFLLQALDFSLPEPRRAVVAGAASQPDTKQLLRAIHSVYQPNKVVLGNAGPVEPFATTLPAKEGATVYICTGTTCQPPTSDVGQIRKWIE